MTDAPSPRCSSGTDELLRDCRTLLVGTKPYVPIGVGILTDFTKMVERIDAEIVRLRSQRVGVAQAAREPGEEHPILKQCDELHDLGFAAGWQGAIEECAKIAAQTAKRCVRERTPGDSVAAFIERAILALPSTDRGGK